jgi:hypothetical protein
LHIKISVLGEWKKIEIIFQPSRTYEKWLLGQDNQSESLGH